MSHKLSTEHAEHLARFRIASELLDAAGVQTVTDIEVRELLAQNGHAGHDLGGILFPYFLPSTGARVGARVRLDRPVTDGAKYLMERACRHYYFAPGSSPLLEDANATVIIVEAEKSALALRSLCDRAGKQFLVIACGGCWGWRRTVGKHALPDGRTEPETGPGPDLDLIAWRGRTTVIAFDSNSATNPDVRKARRALAEELSKRGAKVLIAEIPPDSGVNGPDDLIAVRGDEVTRAVLDSAKPFGQDWPEPESLGDDLPAVPAFELQFLPSSLRPLVADTAERMQVPMDLPASAAVVALASCVNRRAVIQPKREDSSWEVTPNLWGATVAPPGYLKSPVTQQVTLPLSHVEQAWREEYDAAMKHYEQTREQEQLKNQVWREEYKKALKEKKQPPPKPKPTAEEPIQRRLTITDATPEKLQEILADNPSGVMVLRDELAGLIAEMDKEGREQQRAFYLQAWNGYGAFSVDRIGRGSLYLPHVCLSVFGNIQPTRLRSYLGEALEGGPSDDGLFQRFQVLVWPDAPAEWRLVDRPPDNFATAQAEKIFSRLANLPNETTRLKFAPDAQQMFDQWLTVLEHKVRQPLGLHPALVAHLAKYRSLMPSLAALFELADLAAADKQIDAKLNISIAHAEQAILLCTYLEQHAGRAYSCIVSPELHAARELAAHIERGAVPDRFTRRDIYRHHWAALDAPERVEAALTVLEESSWLRRNQTVTGGRPTEAWSVNPRIKTFGTFGTPTL